MSRERDRNTKKFHRAHYEIIAARFREELSRYVSEDGQPNGVAHANSAFALCTLALSLADRFEFDNEDFDRELFLKRCSPFDEFLVDQWDLDESTYR